MLALVVLGAGSGRAAPLTSDLEAPLGGAGEEALARLLYARAAAAAQASGRPADTPAPLPAVETLALRALGEASEGLAGDARDPREFGLDPEPAGRSTASRVRRRTAAPDASLAPGPPSEETVRDHLRAYFRAAVRALSAPRDGSPGGAPPRSLDEDPVAMSLGPVLTVRGSGLTGGRLAFEESALGGATEASITLSEQLAPRPVADDASSGLRRSEVVAGLGSLVRVGEASATGREDGQGEPAYDRDPERVSVEEFARRVMSALLTSPWLYLGLAVLAAARLLARALRPGAR